MTNYKAFTGIPNRPNKPSVDQPNMTINNDSFIAIWDVDHIGFNKNNGGYHKTIHQTPVNSSPATIQNVEQIYSKPYQPQTSPVGTTRLELFTMNAQPSSPGGGQESQLTGHNVSASNFSSGYQFLGGILIQWGQFIGDLGISANPHTLNFLSTTTINFPNQLLNVQLTPTSSATPGNIPSNSNVLVLTVDTVASTKTGFIWASRTMDHSYTGFTWIAIGY